VRGRFPEEKIGVIGCSLGGATILLANPPLKVDAMILEMVYPTIELATKDRMGASLGSWGRLLSPLLTWQLQPRLGIGVEALRPIDRIGKVTVPKFLIAGTKDTHTTFGEAQEMFQTAAEPKEFWGVEGAGHQDLHHFAKDEFQKRVLEFFGKWMKRQLPEK
jgi:fermentation-respiration switch protein FrsA (DUF1100 family)